MPENDDSSKDSLETAARRARAEPEMADVGAQATIVYATFPSLETARAAARRLVEGRLAACVNVIPGMVAVYEWEGVINEDSEVVVIIKTTRAASEACIAAVCEGHPYANPAAVRIDVSGGAAPYLEWIVANTLQRAR